MTKVDVSKAERVLNHLIQESLSQVGAVWINKPEENMFEQRIWLGLTNGEEIHSEWTKEPLFEEFVNNQSTLVFEINKSLVAFRGIYDLGIRHGLFIPVFCQGKYAIVVFLGSSCAYPNEMINLVQKKVQTFAEYLLVSLLTEAVETDRGKAGKESLKERLKRYEQSAKALFDHHPDIMWWMDTDGTILSANSRVEEITGFSKSNFVNRSFDKFIHSKDLDTAISCFYLARKGKPQNFEAAVWNANGDLVDLNITFVPVTVNYKVVGVYGIAKDITAVRKAEQQVVYMTYYDPQTGLPNQKLFDEQLNQILTRDKKIRHPVAVLFLNIHSFTLINDLIGYELTDRVLAAVSRRLTACVREEDMVCRYKGDVFAVGLQGADRSFAARIAGHILHSFQKPFLFDHQEFIVTPSIGISMGPDDGENSDQLLFNADLAMRRAKEKGKNTYYFFNAAMNSRYTLNLLNDLHKACGQKELNVVYQPQVNIRTGRITGVEALLRWKHPEYGIVSPDEFISLAEESGLIIPIGEWVLKQACLQAVAWQKSGFESLKVSVNLSPRQFAQANIVEVIKNVLAQTGLSPKFLDLEITEGMTLDIDRVMETLQELRQLGVQISMDDFGKGYSSLYYLKRLPLDTLKIDRTFVRECTKDEHDATIVKTTISLAHHLHLNVVAEGVETGEQLVFLQRNKCDEVQGYLFCEPVSAEEFMLRFTDIIEKINQSGIVKGLSQKMWMVEQSQGLEYKC